MVDSFRKSVPVIIVLVMAGSIMPVSGKGSTGLDDLATFSEKTMSTTEKNSARASYSKEYEEWSRAYLMGDMEQSDKALAKVLLSIKECESMTLLQRRALPRLLFADIPPGSKLKQVEVMDVFRQWLRVAGKTLGENHRFVGDGYSSLANYCESRKKFSEASNYRMNQYRIYKTAFGEKNQKTIGALYLAASNLYLARDFKAMEPVIKQAIKLSESANYKPGLKNSVRLYVALLKTTNRQKQAQVVASKYGMRL